MATGGVLVSELARRTGTTRKALRLYEASGLIAPTTRTAAGYRIFGTEVEQLVAFIVKARRAGFTVAEIRDIVGIRRSGRAPCDHVRALIDAKLTSIDNALADLKATREALAAMRRSWRTATRHRAAVCPHIERTPLSAKRRRANESDPLH